MVFLPILLSLSFKVMLCFWHIFFPKYSPVSELPAWKICRCFNVLKKTSKTLKNKQTKKPHQTAPANSRWSFISCPMSFITKRNNISLLVEVNITFRPEFTMPYLQESFWLCMCRKIISVQTQSLGMGPTRSWTLSTTISSRVVGSALQYNGFQVTPKMREKA